MKKQLRLDLTDERITDICNSIHYLHKAENEIANIYIEYTIISHKGNLHVGNARLIDEYLIQIDVFSKGSTTKIAEAIEEVMEEKGYIFVEDFDVFESETQLYAHKKRYKYYKERRN